MLDSSLIFTLDWFLCFYSDAPAYDDLDLTQPHSTNSTAPPSAPLSEAGGNGEGTDLPPPPSYEDVSSRPQVNTAAEYASVSFTVK